MVAFEGADGAPAEPEAAVSKPEQPAALEEAEPLDFIPVTTDVKSVEDLEANVEFIRRRASARPVEGQIKTPDDIVRELEQLKYLAGLNTLVLREAAKTRKEYRKLAIRARALAVRRATGRDAKTRELQIEVIAGAQIDAAEDAEIAYDYAKSVAQLVYENKSSVQTQAKQVELSYQLSGSGRGA